MKVTNVVATSEVHRREQPMQDAIQWLDTRGTCSITIETDQGVSGSSDIYFGRGAAAPAVLAKLVNEELAPAVVGEDPFLIRGIRDKLWRETDYHGTAGLAMFGIAGIDLALWDFARRALEQPVWRLLGAYRDKVPTYAMVGWLNYDLDTLKAIVVKALEQGFRGIKMKVGAPTLDEDVTRIEAVRSVMEPNHLLMVDANQALSVQEALIRGRVFEEMGCFWFEEPIRATISMARPPGARATIPSHRREYLRTGAVPPAVRAAGRRYRAAGYPARGRTHRVPRNRPTAKSFDIPTPRTAAAPSCTCSRRCQCDLSRVRSAGRRQRVQLVDGCYPLPEIARPGVIRPRERIGVGAAHEAPRPERSHDDEPFRPLLAITMGDPAGIGPEVVLKALRHADVYERCRPLGIGDRATLDRATGWVDAGDLRFDV